MNLDLGVVSYAVAGCAEFPASRRRSLPPPGPRGRRARLPELAVELARCATRDEPVPAATSVAFGTSLGCMTETESFLENMIENDEEGPKPRAFSMSVHNAVASRLAIVLGAKGECRTFTHGEISFVQACAAAGRRNDPAAPVLFGALDEDTAYVARGRAVCDPDAGDGAVEGGALFYCADGAPLARIRKAAYTRSADHGAWLTHQLDGDPPDVTLLDLRGPRFNIHEVARTLGGRAIASRRWTGGHPSACASACALGVALLAGEVDPARVGGSARPRSVAVVAGSRLGDLGLVLLES